MLSLVTREVWTNFWRQGTNLPSRRPTSALMKFQTFDKHNRIKIFITTQTIDAIVWLQDDLIFSSRCQEMTEIWWRMCNHCWGIENFSFSVDLGCSLSNKTRRARFDPVFFRLESLLFSSRVVSGCFFRLAFFRISYRSCSFLWWLGGKEGLLGTSLCWVVRKRKRSKILLFTVRCDKLP